MGKLGAATAVAGGVGIVMGIGVGSGGGATVQAIRNDIHKEQKTTCRRIMNLLSVESLL
jgi:hypothetical protein